MIFVVLENQEANFEATQRVSTIYDKSEIKREPRRENKREEEKGFKAFVKSHKPLCMTIGVILLFVIVFVATSLIISNLEKKDVQIPNLVEKPIKGLLNIKQEIKFLKIYIITKKKP